MPHMFPLSFRGTTPARNAVSSWKIITNTSRFDSFGVCMYRVGDFLFRFRPIRGSSSKFLHRFCDKKSLIPKTTCIGFGTTVVPLFSVSKGQPQNRIILFFIRNMSTSTRRSSLSDETFHLKKIKTSSLPVDEREMVSETGVLQNEVFDSVEDAHGGVRVEIKEPHDSKIFSLRLRTSLSYWRLQEKRGVWIKLPIEFANLVEQAVQEGFRYHHAEPDYLMLVKWTSETVDRLPANASHRVGIGAFVMNDKREVLVVQERNGRFKNTKVWKLPTGVVNEGEDICMAAIREVKEETGVDTEFIEVLAIRQSHQSFFQKSDLLFICMLRPLSFNIQEQDSEIEAAQWMSADDYAAQPFNQKNELFKNIAKICLTKSEKDYTGFSTMCTTTSSGKTSYLYYNKRDFEFEPSA